jgi:hypothetical protein
MTILRPGPSTQLSFAAGPRLLLALLSFQMLRTFCTRSLLPFSRTFRKVLSTASPGSPPESHGLLPTSQSPITPNPHFFNAVSSDGKLLPTYRIIDGVGNVIEGAELPEVRVPVALLLSWA